MWAVVEIMGHRTRAGMIGDATLGGATMLRIEHPTRADATGNEPECEYYAPQALFAVRPCSHDEAIRVAEWAWPPIHTAERPPAALEAAVYDDDDDPRWEP